jgi:Mrp family chromosome partitioning ATPase
MTTDQIGRKRSSSFRVREHAAPFARYALNLTARTAFGAAGIVTTSLRGFRRSAAGSTEIAFPNPFLQPASQSVESMFQTSVGAGARIVAVIGVQAGDGASVCARALADRSALAPSKTLLVDASAIQRAIPPSSQPAPENLGWFNLTANSEDGFRLRSPEFLRRLWEEAHRDWETVIIDCGSALDVRASAVPGPLTARSADAVILVCLAGTSTSEMIDAAKAALGPVNIVGIVVNGRDVPTVGVQIAQKLQRTKWFFPRLARRLAARALRSKALNVPA